MLEKQCCRCKIIKPVNDFHKCASRRDGLQHRCKECQNKLTRDWGKTPIGREVHRKAGVLYRHTEKGKIQKRNGMKRLRKTAHGKEYKRNDYFEFVGTERGKTLNKLWKNKYAKSEKGKESAIRKDAKRRSILKTVPNTLTADQWKLILEKYRHQCVYCGASDKALTRDHWIPLARGGHHTMENIVPACKSCNSRKRDKNPLFLF